MTEQATQEHVRRARSLFEFLRDVQRLEQDIPRHVSSYELALDLADLDPFAPLGTTRLTAQSWDLEHVAVLPRLPKTEPPPLMPGIKPFLATRVDDPTRRPTVVPELVDAATRGVASPDVVRRLGGLPADTAVSAFEDWLKGWDRWAEREGTATEVRRHYTTLFEADEQARSEAQVWELALGLGRLRWRHPDGYQVDRPLLTVTVQGRTRRRDGALELFVPPAARLRLETDMLDPADLTSFTVIDEASRPVTSTPATTLELSEVMDALTGIVNTGLREGRLVDDAELMAAGGAVVALRPMVVLRKRGNAATAQALDKIAAALAEDTTLPPGLATVVDPSFAPDVPADDQLATDGAIVFRAGEHFTPLPVNARQWDVLRRADSRPLTLVQGPPGTGKTHTTAALISHLLAQGKRILVTAQSEQALGEVRDKLPAEVRALAVSVLGSGQQEMSELQTAVRELSNVVADYDDQRNADDQARLLAEIEVLLDERSSLIDELVRSRQQESEAQSTPFGAKTYSELAQEWRAGRNTFAWAEALLGRPAVDEPAPDAAALQRLNSQLREVLDDPRLDEARGLSGSQDDVPSPDDVSSAVSALASRESALSRLEATADVRVVAIASERPRPAVAEAETMLSDAATSIRDLESRREPWVRDAVADITTGRIRAWSHRMQDIEGRLKQARQLMAQLRPFEPVSIAGDRAVRRRQVELMLGYVVNGGALKRDKTGQPKQGVFTPKPVKDAWEVFTACTVQGQVPVSAEQLTIVRDTLALDDLIDGLDAAWPEDTNVSTEDSPSERLAWHEDELGVLEQVLRLPSQHADAGSAAAAAGLPPVPWHDSDALLRYVDALQLSLLRATARDLEAELQQLATRLRRLGELEPAAAAVDAVTGRDTAAYESAARRLTDLLHLRDRHTDVRRQQRELAQRLPALADALPAEPTSELPAHLGEAGGAWHWLQLDSWLRAQQHLDPNRIQRQILATEDEVRDKVGQLAAKRAWRHAVARLTNERRADLNAYVTLVKRLGKGTGKYAARRRAEIQEQLDRSRDSVPVWIMPLFRVAESLTATQNAYDVVIVDEASQAGLDGLMLQYLAPTVVIVGDDKQVSPTSFADQEKVRALVDRYLHWSPQKAVYADPARSLFDEARMRFPDLITLTEHRRCVPAIIGFSDAIAYRPEGVGLQPVREVGSDALPPLLVTRVDGQRVGKRNDTEAGAVVDFIVSATADPRYAGKTFGVISLLGSDQAKPIAAELLERLGPDVYKQREIRCGEPPNFQGAERDVIVLSMVATTNDDDKRIVAQTSQQVVQRYNVAASRAKDQLHLVHSVDPGRLNPVDMRSRLITYMTEHAVSDTVPEPSVPVGEDERDRRFPSMLAQRVHDMLAEHRYQVEPRYSALSGQVDLVVVGRGGKAAVQCMDDTWPGDQAYRATLAYESELMRSGWRIYRVRQSQLAIDPDGTLRQLRDFLAGAGIYPVELPAEAADQAAALEPDAERREPPEVVAERFLTHVRRSRVLPPLGPDVLRLLEPTSFGSDCWTTTPELDLRSAPVPGTVLEWSQGALTVRTVDDDFDVVVAGDEDDLRWLPVMRAVTDAAVGHDPGDPAVTAEINLLEGGEVVVDGHTTHLTPDELATARLVDALRGPA